MGRRQAGRVRRKKADGVDQALFDVFTRLPGWVPIFPAGLVWVLAWRLVPGSGGQLGAVLAAAILLIGLAALVERRRRAQLAARQRTLDDLRALTWREFEDVVAEAYRQQGYRVESTAGGADGGVDLILRRQTEMTVVQCKRWKQRQVPVSIVRELHGVMTAESAHAAILVSSGRFTDEAVAFARGKRLTLVDGTGLLLLLHGHRAGTETVEQRAAPTAPAPVDVVSAPARTDPPTTCPRCGKVMVLRSGQFGAFFGCPSYPRCRGTRPADSARRAMPTR